MEAQTRANSCGNQISDSVGMRDNTAYAQWQLAFGGNIWSSPRSFNGDDGGLFGNPVKSGSLLG